jgi:hydroxypyruvate isomerase
LFKYFSFLSFYEEKRNVGMNRKEMLPLSTVLGVGAFLADPILSVGQRKSDQKIYHSVCRWCFQQWPLDTFCQVLVENGYDAIDLLPPSQWPLIKNYGLICSMATPESYSLSQGFNDPGLHAQLQNTYSKLIRKAAKEGVKRIVCFSGNRREGLDDEKGLEYCVQGLKPLIKVAADHGITIMMELLNSKVDHPGYQADHTSWGVELCQRIDSDHFKLLYDIYHMQIMEGNIIATIQNHINYIGHFHTAGVPGRNEIGFRQELNYRAIVQAIAALGFQGFIAQEFVPQALSGVKSLAEAREICRV